MKVLDFTNSVVIITAIVFVPISAIESLDLSFVNKGFKKQNSSNVIDRLAATARVITAITLHNGLSDKSISVDDVIAELLNFEPHELKSLKTVDEKAVENFLTKLADFKLVDVVTVDAARTLGNMYKFKEMWSQIGDTIEFPNDAAYKQLDNIKSLKVSGLEKLDFKPAIDALNQSILTDTNVAELKKHLNSITTKIESTKGTDDIDGFINTLNQLKPLQYIHQIFTIYGEREYFTSIRPGAPDGLVQEFGELKDLVRLSKSSPLDSLAKLVSSRFVHHPINRMHTSGFINGYKDLNSLSVDEGNAWLFNSTMLRNMAGIHQLSQTTPLLKKLDEAWNEMFSLKQYKSIQDVASLQKSLLSITDVPSWADVEKFTNDVKTCANAPDQGQYIRNFKDISENTNILFKKLTTIRGALQSVEKLKTDYIPKLATSTSIETIVKLRELVMKLENDVKVLLVGKSVVEVDMQTAGSDIITGFKKQFSSNIASFNCIRDIKSRFGEVTLSAMSLVQIREMKEGAKVTKDVNDALAGASKSLKSLTEIRSTFQALKVQSIDDKAILNALKNVSRPFGEAVTALVLGKNLMSKSSDFEMFVRNGYLVEGEVDEHVAVNFRDTFGNTWGDFVKTTENIKTLFTALAELVGKIEGSEKSKMEDVGSLFTDLPNLVDVDLLTDDRLNAVELFENIKPTNEQRQLLDNFKTNLLELSKLDLKFSRFQKSLNSMSDTIDKLVVMMSGISSQVTATTSGGAAVESEGYKFVWWHGALLFFFICCCFLIFCCFCCEIVDYKEENDDIEMGKEKEQLVKTDEEKKEREQKNKKSKGKKRSFFGKRLVWKQRSKKPNQKCAAVAQTPPPPNQTATASKSTETAAPSGSGTNNAASTGNKTNGDPVKTVENEKKKGADKDGKTGETDKAAATTTGDTTKAGGSTIPNKTEVPADDKNDIILYDFVAKYPRYGVVKPKSFPNAEAKRRWINDALDKINKVWKADREERERNRDPSTLSSDTSTHNGLTEEEANMSLVSEQLKIKYMGKPGENLHEGIPEEEHIDRNADPTRDDPAEEFSEKGKK